MNSIKQSSEQGKKPFTKDDGIRHLLETIDGLEKDKTRMEKENKELRERIFNLNDDTLHIIPSGFHKTLCGLSNRKGSSMGFGCNCSDCMNKGQEIINALRKSEKDSCHYEKVQDGRSLSDSQESNDCLCCEGRCDCESGCYHVHQESKREK